MLWDKHAVPFFTPFSFICHVLMAESPAEQFAGGKGLETANKQDFRWLNSWGIKGEYIHMVIHFTHCFTWFLMNTYTYVERQGKVEKKNENCRKSWVWYSWHKKRPCHAALRREAILTVAWSPASSSTGVSQPPKQTATTATICRAGAGTAAFWEILIKPLRLFSSRNNAKRFLINTSAWEGTGQERKIAPTE